MTDAGKRLFGAAREMRELIAGTDPNWNDGTPWTVSSDTPSDVHDVNGDLVALAFGNDEQGQSSLELCQSRARAIAALPDLYDALDKIFSYVSYVNIHGVGEQPQSNGEPQPVRLSLEEFWRIFQEIGKLSSAALAKARGGTP